MKNQYHSFSVHYELMKQLHLFYNFPVSNMNTIVPEYKTDKQNDHSYSKQFDQISEDSNSRSSPTQASYNKCQSTKNDQLLTNEEAISSSPKPINFSIDYILGHKDENSQKKCDDQEEQSLNVSDEGDIDDGDESAVQYDWLTYTRYKPPKLQRIRKKDCVQKRRLGRNPRIPFSTEQVAILEEKFQTNPYLNNDDVAHLSKCLQLSDTRIKIWFQNRRARERREQNDNNSKKGVNSVESFLLKTRSNNKTKDVSAEDEVQDLSVSAFKPCSSSSLVTNNNKIC